MLRDRATPVDLFTMVPLLQLRFEPELEELDRLLEDDQLFRSKVSDGSQGNQRDPAPASCRHAPVAGRTYTEWSFVAKQGHPAIARDV